MPADGRHEGEKGARLENAGAERIDDSHRLRPQSLDHARRADMGMLVELQWIGIGGIEAAPEDTDRPQPRDGAHHQLIVDDRDILALQQHEAEIAGDIGVLVIGLIGRPRRQDGDTSFGSALAAKKRIAKGTEEGGKTMNLGFGIDIGKGTGGSDPGFQRKAGAGWCLCAVGQYPPVAIRTAADLESQEMQIMATCGLDADKRAQEFRIAGNQRRWQKPFVHEPIVAIDIGDD